MAQAALGAAAPLRLFSSRPCSIFSFFSKDPHRLLINGSPFSTAFRGNALRPPTTLLPEDDEPIAYSSSSSSSSNSNSSNSNSSDDPLRKSRNDLKREARRAVKWGMELARFSNAQIKRVLRIASLDEDVFDALMLVKRLGPDVREGKRRQFSYIGRLLRDAQPELMEALIQASKDGDNSKLHALSGGESVSIKFEEEEEDIISEEEEDDDSDGCESYVEVAAKWFNGLVYKDQSITNEVYSIHNVEFDRQELRKLVRRVQSVQECMPIDESGAKNDSELTREKKPLVRFLHSLAKKSLAG